MDRPAPARPRGIPPPPVLIHRTDVIDFLAELWAFMVARKKLWLLPLLVILLLLGGLIVFAQGSALAPFIYSIF
nr:DUF5989 family protein [Longimicrobium terrae]